MYYPIPILMYHNISKEKNYTDVHVKAFHKQMQLMKKMGYEAVNLNKMNSKNVKKKLIIEESNNKVSPGLKTKKSFKEKDNWVTKSTQKKTLNIKSLLLNFLIQQKN